MKKESIDYTKMTELCAKLGMVPYSDRMGQIKPGVYTLQGLAAPVDLSASAEDEISILKNAVRQLSEEANEAWHRMVEMDLND